MTRRWLLSLFLFGVLPLAATAQDTAPPDEYVESEDEELDQPTTIGVRFTPRIAEAMSKKFIEAMQPKYELDDDQAEDIRKLMQRNLMTFTRKNAETGRDMIELMMATVIENDGRFPKEEAVKFANMAMPFVPKLRDFFTESSAEIGKRMNLKQRLQFTGDMTLAAAGLGVFESRMKRWQDGKIGDFANPFYDPADKDPSKAEPRPVDPKEHPEHRRARAEVEAINDWEMKIDERWETYVTQATEFYGFDEKQKQGAESVLKDCRERAKLIKTPEWSNTIRQNRIARRLTRNSGSKLSDGPWIYSLERDYKKLRQPLMDLEDEFKRRIDELPTSTQRATAREEVRKTLAARGMKDLPT